MKLAQRIALLLLCAAVLAAGSFYAGRHSSGSIEMAMAGSSAASGAAEKKVLYWHDPMVPGQRFDKPGASA